MRVRFEQNFNLDGDPSWFDRHQFPPTEILDLEREKSAAASKTTALFAAASLVGALDYSSSRLGAAFPVRWVVVEAAVEGCLLRCSSRLPRVSTL